MSIKGGDIPKKRVVVTGNIKNPESHGARNLRTYNMVDVLHKSGIKRDERKEKAVANSAEAFNRDEMKFPDDYYTILRLMNQYGENARLGLILTSFRPIGYKCPRCNGTGKVKERYCHDLLAVSTGCEEWKYRDGKCPLCDGSGAVPKKMKPKMVQDGWEEA